MKSSRYPRLLSPPRLWRRIRHIKIENKGLKLLSLLLAILLFAVSRQPISDLKLFNVPLEFRGLSPNVEISGAFDQTVSVRVRGPRDIVRSLTPNQLSVVADLTSKEAGERTVQLRPDDVSLPDDSIQVIQIEPASIPLYLELKLRKSVAVEAQFTGQLAEGLEVYRTSIEPQSVEIEGPQSQINKIGRVLTETVNLSGRNRDFAATVDVETPHRSLRVLTVAPVNLSVEIGERRSFKRLAGIPVHLFNQPSNGKLLTKTVEVELYGPKSAVEALKPKDLRVDVNAENLADGISFVQPQLILPAGTNPHIEVRSIYPKEVKVKK